MLRIYRPDADPGLSLSEYFQAVYLPAVTTRRPRPLRTGTVRRRAAAVAWWQRLTGDPAVADITQQTFDGFVAALASAKWTRGRTWRPLSAASQYTTAREVLTILRTVAADLGSPGVSIRLDAEAPPCFPKPTWTLGDARRIAAAVELLPIYKPRRPPNWWSISVYHDLAKATLALWYFTGHRASSAWEWPSGYLVEMQPGRHEFHVAKSVKTAKPDRLVCHPQLADLLQRLPAGKQLIPWPSRYDYFRAVIHARLCELAGVPNYGGQGWRRLHCQQMAEAGLGVAQQLAVGAMGHSSGGITAAHYCDARSIVILKMPELF